MHFHTSRAEVAALPAQRNRGLVARLLSALVLALVALCWSASPASAHDEHVGTEFELADDGSIESVVLSFSAVILDVGTEIQLTGPDGADATDGEPVQAGRDVTQALQPDLAEGIYDVVWRVVSSDGHPIDGAFSFEVSNEPGFEPSVLPFSQEEGAESAEADHEHEHEHGDADSEGTETDAAETESAETDDAVATADDSGFPVGLTIGIIAAALLVIAAIVVLVRRRRGTAQPNEQNSATTDS